MMVGLVIGIRQNGWDGAKKKRVRRPEPWWPCEAFSFSLLKAPSSKEIAAGPAYFRPISKKRIFVITITSRAQRRSSSPQKIEAMKAVHVYQSKYSPRSLGKISEESRRNPRG